MNEEKLTSKEETSETKETEVSKKPEQKSNMKSKWGIIALLIAVVAVGIAFLANPSSDKEAVVPEDSSSVAAVVDGVEITRAELDERLEQVRSSIPAGSPDPTQDAGFEFQLLDELINFELLLAEAQGKGLSVSDEEVSTELEALVTAFGGQEALEEQLALTGITQDQLRENMHNEILIQKLLDTETDIENVTASDEEILAMYDEVAAGAPEDSEVPPLEQVQDILRSQLIQQKSAAIIEAYISSLRDSAEIEVTL